VRHGLLRYHIDDWCYDDKGQIKYTGYVPELPWWTGGNITTVTLV
jgi:hypothetical protein